MKKFLMSFSQEFVVEIEAVDKMDAYNRIMQTPVSEWNHKREPDVHVHMIIPSDEV